MLGVSLDASTVEKAFSPRQLSLQLYLLFSSCPLVGLVPIPSSVITVDGLAKGLPLALARSSRRPFIHRSGELFVNV